jgi:hypothetical protein
LNKRIGIPRLPVLIASCKDFIRQYMSSRAWGYPVQSVFQWISPCASRKCELSVRLLHFALQDEFFWNDGRSEPQRVHPVYGARDDFSLAFSKKPCYSVKVCRTGDRGCKCRKTAGEESPGFTGQDAG